MGYADKGDQGIHEKGNWPKKIGKSFWGESHSNSTEGRLDPRA